jgi:hypothetical protein
MGIISPFDFERIFISILSGSQEIFIGIFILMISAVGAYFHMDGKVMMLIYVVFGIVFSFYIGALYTLIILIIGLITFFSLTKFGR